jgi:cation transport ATPase
MLEVQMGAVLAFKERVDQDLYNHGQDGLKTRFNEFMSRVEEQEKTKAEKEKDRDIREQRWRFFISTVLGVIVMIVSMIGIFKH